MVHQWQLDNAYDRSTGEYDFDRPFRHVVRYLDSADLTVGNLETVFAGSETGYTCFPRFNSPDSLAEAVHNAGFDLLTTANNHSNDRNEAGILRTLEVLDGCGIGHFGTYRSEEDRSAVFIREVNGVRIAFLSFTYGTNGLPLTNGKPWLCNVMSDRLIDEDIAAAKALEPDLVIVMPHMGNEYELKPNQVFKNWVQKMFDAGADIVIASHPHVLQPFEFTDGKFVAYSMGNFISSQRDVPRDCSVILNITAEKTDTGTHITEISYIPTWVMFRNSDGVQDIRVVSVYDALTGEIDGLRDGDRNRLWNVHDEIALRYLGEKVPREEILNEYIFYSEE